ncbi:MAG: succinate-semialdehyde dehydrogenase / glutarate-semialdehyde dehydrogenase [Mycobacterium sp.]|jgi:succinate-semialdehyde dehydrogenase/glutarate-semialdehyde dehydrogenase|nr:succinate-semialdehyde dehydrogenase / glutarate-semialdehyde dehydrogenase [Mycobacterium sp.]
MPTRSRVGLEVLARQVQTTDGDVMTVPTHGRTVAARLQAGTVNINQAYAAAWASVDAPMGGMKASGIGRRRGELGILKYTEPQTIAVERLLPSARRVGCPPAVTRGS